MARQHRNPDDLHRPVLLDTVVDILTTYTPPVAIVFALVMAMVVGLLSGVYPALKAARLDPVQALRFE